MTRRDEVEYLLGRSKEFLETAKYQIDTGFMISRLTEFKTLEQALRLYLKSKALVRGVDYPRTHRVRTR